MPNGYASRISKEIFEEFFWEQLFEEKVEINTVAAGYCGPPGFEKACKELFAGQGFKAGTIFINFLMMLYIISNKCVLKFPK